MEARAFSVLLLTVLSTGLLCTAEDSSEASQNPGRVIRLTFPNKTDVSPSVPERLLPSNYPDGGDLPIVYCRNSAYPDDVLCDVGMLLEKDVYPSNMKLVAFNTAMPDPVRTGKFCKLNFVNYDKDKTKPMSFQEIDCGRDREIISEDSLTAPDGIDSLAMLPRFNVADMDDIVLMSYDSGFGCRHRLKRYRAESSGTKNKVRGSYFQLDSFFCSIGFGIAEGRPESPYPPQSYYKYDGKRWRPKDIWPDYL